MATRVRISCINKTDRSSHYERIQSVGGKNDDGTNWKMSEDRAIAAIEDGTYSFYVHADGRTIDVVVAKSAAGHKYLKTVADGLQPDNLLALPECP